MADILPLAALTTPFRFGTPLLAAVSLPIALITRAIAWAPDSKRLASALDNTVHVWQIEEQ
jgi:hypothetical protein